MARRLACRRASTRLRSLLRAIELKPQKAAASETQASQPSSSGNAKPQTPNPEPGTQSPAVRRLAGETGVDPASVSGTGKAGRHALPYLKDRGYDLLNVDLRPSEHPDIRSLIADLTDSGQAFNALTTHFGFDGFNSGKPPAAPDAVVHFAAIPRVLIEPDNETSSRVSTSSELNRRLLLRRSRRRLVHVLLHALLTVGFDLLELRLLVRS